MLLVPRPAAVSRLLHAGQRPLLLLSPAPLCPAVGLCPPWEEADHLTSRSCEALCWGKCDYSDKNLEGGEKGVIL